MCTSSTGIVSSVGLTSLAIPSIADTIALFDVGRRFLGRGRIDFAVGWGHGVTPDGDGTYLAACLSLFNPGRNPIYFGGFAVRGDDGETQFPMSDLDPGCRLEPGQYVNARIPAGHLLNPTRAVALWATDGVGRRHSVPPKVLRKLIVDLAAERDRLAGLGYPIYPSSNARAHVQRRPSS